MITEEAQRLPSVINTLDRGAIETWLRTEVANGDPRQDTIDSYRIQLNHWFSWCGTNNVDPALVSRTHVEAFRRELVEAGMEASTIAVKLTVVRQFYRSAVQRGLISVNPATDVLPPINRKVRDRKKNLNQNESNQFLDVLPVGASVQALRDRAIVALFLLEGLRRVELHRGNVEDIETLEYEADGGQLVAKVRILVHGKRRDRYCYPREDSVEVLKQYIAVRGPVKPEEATIHNRIAQVTPLFCCLSKTGNSSRRLSRRGLNWIIDGYLDRSGLKKEGISCHALRHTCGYLTYKETKDIRAVQDVLGHVNIATSAIYAASDQPEVRHTEKIRLTIRQ